MPSIRQKFQNFIRFRSIKSKLVGAFLLILLLASGLVLSFFWFIQTQNRSRQVYSRLNSVNQYLDKAKLQEKNFSLASYSQDSLSDTERKEYLNFHQKYLQRAKINLLSLAQESLLSKSSIDTEILRFKDALDAYELLFDRMIALTRKKGDSHAGLISELKRWLNQIQKENPDLGSALLELSLLQERYLHSFSNDLRLNLDNEIDILRTLINGQLAADQVAKKLNSLNFYQKKLQELHQTELEIGSNAEQGLRAKIQHLNQQFLDYTVRINKGINQEIANINQAMFQTLIILLLVFTGIIILLGYLVIEKMGKPINKLSDSIHEVIDHNFLNNVQIYEAKANDEIGGISRDVAWMVERVRERDQVSSQQQMELADSYQNLKLLSEIGQAIVSQLSVEDIVKVVFDRVNELMDTAVFGIATLNSERKRLEFMSEEVLDETIIARFAYLNKANLASQSFKEAREIIIQDMEAYEKEHPAIQEGHAVLDLVPQSQVFIPLISLDESIGVITVQSFIKNAYKDYHLDILRNTANYISVALENANIYTRLNQKNKKVIDSISYAQRIQAAILPSTKSIQEALPESFILFKPRDIVSGDFYWFAQTEPKAIYEEVSLDSYNIRSEFKGYHRPKTVLAAVDCTGHGIPGAFMSMVGNDILDNIVLENNVTAPDEILNRLHSGIRHVMKKKHSENADGMDVALCVIDFEEGVLEYSGAFNPLVCIREGEMTIIAPDRKPVGVWYRSNEQRAYTSHQIRLDKPSTFYIFSDGYADQLGGSKRKKFLSKRLHRLLYEIHKKPMFEQKVILEKRLQEWIGEGTQNDDILVMGFYIEPPNYYENV